MLLILITSLATLEATLEIDLSTLDLKNFQYFKYQTTTSKPILLHKNGQFILIRKIVEKPTVLNDGVARANSVYKYLKSVIFGNPLQKLKFKYVFDPDAGEINSVEYQAKFGFRGVKLVESLGNGGVLK